MVVVLIINGGASSLKFAVYELGEAGEAPRRGLSGQLDRIGRPGTCLTVRSPAPAAPTSRPVAVADQLVAVRFLLEWLRQQPTLARGWGFWKWSWTTPTARPTRASFPAPPTG